MTNRRKPPTTTPLRTYLDSLDKAALIALLEQLDSELGEVRAFLRDRLLFMRDQPSELLKEAKTAIASLGNEPGCYGDRTSYPHEEVDVARLLTLLEKLLAQGQNDALLALGPGLMSGSNRQFELEDEGESFDELSQCLAVLFRALSKSSLSPAGQIAWVVDRQMEDRFGLCEEGAGTLRADAFTPAHWAEAATLMERQLPDYPPPASSDDFLRRNDRDKLTSHIIAALDKAGRGDQALELCRREAPLTGSHQRLIDRLLELR